MPKIFIESLPKKCTADMLKKYFLQFVKEVNVKRSKNKGRRIKMYAIVEFASDEEYQKVVSMEHVVFGEKLMVKPFINFKWKKKKKGSPKFGAKDVKHETRKDLKRELEAEEDLSVRDKGRKSHGGGSSDRSNRQRQGLGQTITVIGNCNQGQVASKEQISLKKLQTPEKNPKFEFKNLKLFCESRKKKSEAKGFKVNHKSPEPHNLRLESITNFDLFGQLNIGKKLSFSHSQDAINLNSKSSIQRPSSQGNIDSKNWPSLNQKKESEQGKIKKKDQESKNLKFFQLLRPTNQLQRPTDSRVFEYISEYNRSNLNLRAQLILKVSNKLNLWFHNAQNVRFNKQPNEEKQR